MTSAAKSASPHNFGSGLLIWIHKNVVGRIIIMMHNLGTEIVRRFGNLNVYTLGQALHMLKLVLVFKHTGITVCASSWNWEWTFERVIVVLYYSPTTLHAVCSVPSSLATQIKHFI